MRIIEGNLNQEKLDIVLPEDQLNKEYLKKAKDLLEKNNEYFEQEINDECERIKTQLQVLEKNKDLINKIVEEIEKQKQQNQENKLGK